MTIPDPSLPPHDATPSTIRAYFAVVLHDHYDVPREEAETIAAKWCYGRGSEIAYFDVDTYRSIFGGEVGSLLFRYVGEELRTSGASPSSVLGTGKVAREEVKDIFGLSPGLSFIYMFFGLGIVFALWLWIEMDEANTDRVAAICTILGLSFIGFLFSYTVYYFSPRAQKHNV